MGVLIDLLLELGVPAVKVLIPALIQVIRDWRDGKITAQAAGEAFARALEKLKDPHADGKATDDAVDTKAKEKFGA